MPDISQKTLSFDIEYDEQAITIAVEVNSSPNQDKIQRTLTLEGVLKRQGVKYEIQNDTFRVFLTSESEVEKVIECFRIFEKQDKIKETKLNVHKTIAAEVGERLKSIFPPPEAEVSCDMRDTKPLSWFPSINGLFPQSLRQSAGFLACLCVARRQVRRTQVRLRAIP